MCGTMMTMALRDVGAQATKPPVMTPEQRAQAQAKLNADASALDAARPHDAAREKLRMDITPLRDTLVELTAVAVRLNRASTTGTSSVAISSARQLKLDCAGSATLAIVLQPKTTGWGTTDTRANTFIATYQTALANLVRALQACDHALGTELTAHPPGAAHLNDASHAVQAAVATFNEAQRNLLDLLQVKLPPKGYKDPMHP